ncbi:MAG: diaminopimelate epimerase [Bacteroidota bacterium]|jgi:diaminopimelate epimerase|nr:diaminopimelate epimerase [Bacteroidota bacterium]
MRRIPFTKAHGAKNDFVIVDDRARRLDDTCRREFAQRSAHRRTGIGSDGTIFIENSETCDFRMAFYNPDGSVGSMCGNGGRCAALYAFVRGIAPAEMRFTVLERIYTAHILPDTSPPDADACRPDADACRMEQAHVRLSFPRPLEIELGLTLTTELGVITAAYVDNGAPHLVIFTDDLPASLHAAFDDLDMERVGALLRHHERFAPRGCNVNVLEPMSDDTIRIRTFEKGVEAETWACGTGTLAAGMIAQHRLGAPPPVRLRTHGDDLLVVHFLPDSNVLPDAPEYYARDLALEGPAVLVFDGSYQF